MTSGPGLPTKFQKQGPANNCVIDGKQLGWLSCTCYAFAMAMDQGSANRVVLTGCQVRRGTKDVTGGTTLSQNAPVAEARGINVDVFVGNSSAKPDWLALQVQSGRGAVIQGNTSALLHTPYRSTGSSVNHAVYVGAARGGRAGAPKEALVSDPCADGRKATWGTADQGPTWWPWERVLAFAAALRPWGDNDSRILGRGKIYSAVFPDTNPHFHSKYRGTKSSPFPDRTRALDDDVRVHSKPTKGPASTTRRIKKGDLFVAYQYAKGDTYQGSTKWLGNHDGSEWVHEKRLRHVGGET
jgi:hypothetical protein